MDGEDTSRTVSRVNLPKIPSVYLSLMSFTVWRRRDDVTERSGDGYEPKGGETRKAHAIYIYI